MFVWQFAKGCLAGTFEVAFGVVGFKNMTGEKLVQNISSQVHKRSTKHDLGVLGFFSEFPTGTPVHFIRVRPGKGGGGGPSCLCE